MPHAPNMARTYQFGECLCVATMSPDECFIAIAEYKALSDFYVLRMQDASSVAHISAKWPRFAAFSPNGAHLVHRDVGGLVLRFAVQQNEEEGDAVWDERIEVRR